MNIQNLQGQALPIITEPAAVLYQSAAPIADMTAPDIQQLAADMIATMLAAPGVGLAAPQVDQSVRLITINADEQLFALGNPEIVKTSDTLIPFAEQCLSIPGEEREILRHERITVRYTSLAGTEQKLKARGFLSVVLQHEIDHLNGILITQRYQEQETLRKEHNL